MHCVGSWRTVCLSLIVSSGGCFNPDDSVADTDAATTSDTETTVGGTAPSSTAGTTTQTGPGTETTSGNPTSGDPATGDPASGNPTSSDPTSTTDDTETTEETETGSVPGTPFSITELTDDSCLVLDTSGTIDSRRGAVGLAGGTLIGHGIPAGVGVEAAGLGAAAVVQTPYARREFVLNDLEAKETFLVGTTDGPLLRTTDELGTDAVVATQLFRLDERGRLSTDAPVVLSESITIPNGGTGAGFFNGFGEAAILVENNLRIIDLASGAVTSSSHSLDSTPTSCDNGLFYGVLERSFELPQLVYFTFNRVARQEIGSSSVILAEMGCFWTEIYGADAGFNSCSMAFDVNAANPSQSQWISESPLVEESSTRQTFTECPVNLEVNAGGGQFVVTAFDDYNSCNGDAGDCQVFDSTDATAGAEFGPSVIVGDRVLFTGTVATVSYSRVSTEVDAGERTGTFLDSMVTDLEDGTTYVFAFEGDGIEGAHSAGRANRLVPIDEAGQPLVDDAVALDQTINWGGEDDVMGLFSGYGRVVIHDGTRVLDIDPVSGAVVNRDNVSIPNAQACSQRAFYGVAELVDGDLQLVYRESGSNAIVRHALASGTTEDVAAFADLADVCSVLVDPARDAWYFSHAGASTLSDAAGGSPTIAMALGSCAATFTTE